MTSIRVTPETLYEQAMSVQQYAQEIRDLLLRIDVKVNEINSGWDGLAQNGYADLYQNLKIHLDKTPDMLEGLAKTTQDAAAVFTDVDQKLHQQFSI